MGRETEGERERKADRERGGEKKGKEAGGERRGQEERTPPSPWALADWLSTLPVRRFGAVLCNSAHVLDSGGRREWEGCA